MCSYFMLILVSSKMFRLSVFFFSSITLMQDRFLLHANSKSLFVGVNNDKAHGGANLNTRVFVRCLVVLLMIKFHIIMRMAFLVSILFQQEQNKKHGLQGRLPKLAALKLLHAFLFPKKKTLALHLIQ